MPITLAIPVSDSSQVGEVRRGVARFTRQMNLAETRQSDAAIVANELATNLYRHAEHGRVWLQVLRSNGREVLELLAVDSGPGMADLSRCLSDGYSTAGTAGTGFGAVRRLSDEFDAYSAPGKGTVVMSRIGAGGASTSDAFVTGAVCLCAPHETVSGDTWRIEQEGQDLAVMVADGLGHGPLASEAAERAGDIFATKPFQASKLFYEQAHRALTGSRGAAVARAIVRRAGHVEYSSVGNIATSLIGAGGEKGLAGQNGTVGAELRKQIDSLSYEWPERGILLMHSDGITGRWSLDAYPGLIARHPGVIAGVLCRDFIRGRDDATMVVVARRHVGVSQ